VKIITTHKTFPVSPYVIVQPGKDPRKILNCFYNICVGDNKFKLKCGTMTILGRESGVAEEMNLLEYDNLMIDK